MFSADNQCNNSRDYLPRDGPPTERDRIDERGRSSKFELPVSLLK